MFARVQTTGGSRTRARWKQDGALTYFIFGKGQHIIIGVGDGEFGGAVEGLLKTMDNVNFVMDGVEERPDVGDSDIEQQGTTVRATDLVQGIAEAFKGLEHEGDFAAGDHGPDELTFAFAGDGHDLLETEEFVEFDGRANIFYKKVGGERMHFSQFSFLKKSESKYTKLFSI